jgi:hypothetical protein
MTQMTEIIAMIKTCTWSVKITEDMASYGTDAYGAECQQTRSAVDKIHQRAVPAICVQEVRNIPLRRNMSLYKPV